jgi:hypothetical protein
VRLKWAPTTVSLPGCAAGEGKSTLDITLKLFLSHPPPSQFLLQQSLSCCPRSITAFCPSICFYSNLTICCLLSLLPLPFSFVSFTSVMGRRRTAEDYQRTAAENGWVPGAHGEEDSIQQAKDEPTDRYKTEPAGSPRSVDNVGARLCRQGLCKSSSPLTSQSADELHVVSCRHRVCQT